jgi:C-terminal processing protease CtpA/Prc
MSRRRALAGSGGSARRAGAALGWTALLLACAAPAGTIGAVLARAPDGTLRIREAPTGLAAAEAGLTPGDQILLIDGVDVRALAPDQIHEALAGKVGEPVKLTAVRNGEILRVTLERTPIPAKKHHRGRAR